MSSFAPIAFQSSLSTEAILFGVFGFLYSVYGLYSNPSSSDNLQRPPIVTRIRLVCRVIAVLITFNAMLSITALASLYYSGYLTFTFSGKISNLLDTILSAGFALTMVAIAIISLLWAFRNME